MSLYQKNDCKGKSLPVFIVKQGVHFIDCGHKLISKRSCQESRFCLS